MSTLILVLIAALACAVLTAGVLLVRGAVTFDTGERIVYDILAVVAVLAFAYGIATAFGL